MHRIAIEKLLKWKQSKRRKPLIIEGDRQVGKTWLMKEFGKQAYADTVYINFDSNSRMAELFASDLDTERLIMGLELYVGRKIDPGNSLLIFDEVQEAGGQLERSEIKARIADMDDQIAEFAEIEKKSKKTGNTYKEFNFKFNFAIKDVLFIGLLTYTDTSPVTLTEKG